MIFHFSHASFGIAFSKFETSSGSTKHVADTEVNGGPPYKTVQPYPDRNARRSWHRYIRS